MAAGHLGDLIKPGDRNVLRGKWNVDRFDNPRTFKTSVSNNFKGTNNLPLHSECPLNVTVTDRSFSVCHLAENASSDPVSIKDTHLSIP